MYELWWSFQFKTICKSFHCKKNFLLKICTYWCKETIDIIDVKKLLTFFAILIGSVIVLSSAIITDTLLTFFLQNMILCIPCHIVLKSFLFSSKWCCLLCLVCSIILFLQFLYDLCLMKFCCLFFCFYHLFIKFISFLHWSFGASSYPWLKYYFLFSFFTVLIDACLSKILWMTL